MTEDLHLTSTTIIVSLSQHYLWNFFKLDSTITEVNNFNRTWNFILPGTNRNNRQSVDSFITCNRNFFRCNWNNVRWSNACMIGSSPDGSLGMSVIVLALKIIIEHFKASRHIKVIHRNYSRNAQFIITRNKLIFPFGFTRAVLSSVPSSLSLALIYNLHGVCVSGAQNDTRYTLSIILINCARNMCKRLKEENNHRVSLPASHVRASVGHNVSHGLIS